MSNKADKEIIEMAGETTEAAAGPQVDDLSAFLVENIEDVRNLKFVLTDRIKDKNGKAVVWELRHIPTDEVERIRKSCYIRKKKTNDVEFDSDKYINALAVAAVVYPPLNIETLWNNHGVYSEAAFLKSLLRLAGEYERLIAKIKEMNGFDVDMEELVDEAKN